MLLLRCYVAPNRNCVKNQFFAFRFTVLFPHLLAPVELPKIKINQQNSGNRRNSSSAVVRASAQCLVDRQTTSRNSSLQVSRADSDEENSKVIHEQKLRSSSVVKGRRWRCYSAECKCQAIVKVIETQSALRGIN